MDQRAVPGLAWLPYVPCTEIGKPPAGRGYLVMRVRRIGAVTRPMQAVTGRRA